MAKERSVLTELRKFLDIPASEFLKDWKSLSEKDKKELKEWYLEEFPNPLEKK